jgi:hypothetical protein
MNHIFFKKPRESIEQRLPKKQAGSCEIVIYLPENQKNNHKKILLKLTALLPVWTGVFFLCTTGSMQRVDIENRQQLEREINHYFSNHISPKHIFFFNPPRNGT